MQQIARLGAGGTSAARKMAEAGGCFSQCLPGTLREAGVQVSQFLLWWIVGLLQKLETKKKFPCDIFIHIYILYTLIYFGVGVLHYH